MAKITGIAFKANSNIRIDKWGSKLIFDKGKTGYNDIYTSSTNNFLIQFTNITPDMVQFMAEVPVNEWADYDVVKLVIN